MNQQVNEYNKVDTRGNSQAELIVKVYNGAISNLIKAKECIETERLNESHDALEAAKKFVVHLYTTLDMEKGGDIAKKLSDLYGFAVNEINLIQSSKDVNQIDAITEILNNLKEGWSELAQKDKKDNNIESENKKIDTKQGLSLSV